MKEIKVSSYEEKDHLEFELTGKPIAQKRPRFSRGRIYNPMSIEKTEVKNTLKYNIPKNGLYFDSEQLLKINIIFYTPLPKQCSKAKKTALEGSFDKTRPDLDNYVKFYLDAFNEIIYEDDKNIVSLHAEKRKSKNPRVKVEVQSV